VQRAPGIPCALYLLGRTIAAQAGRIAPRRREAASISAAIALFHRAADPTD
jgi:hypothetical protein